MLEVPAAVVGKSFFLWIAKGERIALDPYDIGLGKRAPAVTVSSHFGNFAVQQPALQCNRRNAHLLRCRLQSEGPTYFRLHVIYVSSRISTCQGVSRGSLD